MGETVLGILAPLLKSETQMLAQERMKAGKANPTPKSVQGSKASRETDAVLASKAGVGKTLRQNDGVFYEPGRRGNQHVVKAQNAPLPESGKSIGAK